MPRTFLFDVTVGQTMQFVVNVRNQPIQGPLIAPATLQQQLSYSFLRALRHKRHILPPPVSNCYSRPREENSLQHPPICADFSRYLIEAHFGAQPWHGGDIYERYVMGADISRRGLRRNGNKGGDHD